MKTKVNYILNIFIIMLLLLQIVLQEKIPIFKFLDEVVALVALLFFLKKIFAEKVEKEIFTNLVLCLIITLLGILGNIVFRVQNDFKAIIIDISSVFKYLITFYGFYFYYTKKDQYLLQKIIQVLNTFCIVIIIPGVLLAILNFFIDIGMHTEYIYGFRAFHYIFYRVGNLYAFCVRALIIMTLDLLFNKNKKRQSFFIVANLFLMISTLRSRAIIYAFLYVIGYYVFIVNKQFKFKFRYLIIIGMISTIIAFPKLNYYFVENADRARAVLLRFSIITALNYFPFGTGFATYGTYAASKYRSLLYSQYNFNRYYGLGEVEGNFLMDNYWPAILAEFGVIGFALNLILIYRLFRYILKNTSNSIIKFSAVFGFVTITMDSVVSSAFFNTLSVGLMVLIALSIALQKRMIYEQEKIQDN